LPNLAKPEKTDKPKNSHSNLKNLQLLLKKIFSTMFLTGMMIYIYWDYSFLDSGCVPILAVYDSGCVFFCFCFYDATYRMKTWNWLFTKRLKLRWKQPRPDSRENDNNTNKIQISFDKNIVNFDKTYFVIIFPHFSSANRARGPKKEPDKKKLLSVCASVFSPHTETNKKKLNKNNSTKKSRILRDKSYFL